MKEFKFLITITDNRPPEDLLSLTEQDVVDWLELNAPPPQCSIKIEEAPRETRNNN